jgi:hypothetical protein
VKVVTVVLGNDFEWSFCDGRGSGSPTANGFALAVDTSLPSPSVNPSVG